MTAGGITVMVLIPRALQAEALKGKGV